MSLLVQRHDLLFYDRDPSVQKAVTASGDSGRLVAPPGDFLYVVDDNRSYNKINPYVQESATYNTEILPDMWQDSVLTLHFHLNPSPANLEGQGPDYGQKGDKHDYEDALRVFVPAGATLDSVSSSLKRFTPSVGQPAYGMTAFSGYFILREGQTLTVVFRYHIPANVFTWSKYRRYQLTIPRQPGENLSVVGVHVATVAGVRLRLPDGRATLGYSRDFLMSQDQQLRLGVEGKIDPQPLPVVKSTPSLDPFIPFSAFRQVDPRHPL